METESKEVEGGTVSRAVGLKAEELERFMQMLVSALEARSVCPAHPVPFQRAMMLDELPSALGQLIHSAAKTLQMQLVEVDKTVNGMADFATGEPFDAALEEALLELEIGSIRLRREFMQRLEAIGVEWVKDFKSARPTWPKPMTELPVDAALEEVARQRAVRKAAIEASASAECNGGSARCPGKEAEHG